MDKEKFSFTDTLRENLALAVYSTGYQHCVPGHKWGPGLRDHYLVHYVHSGRGTYTVSGHTYPLAAGDMFFVFPGVSVSYAADREEPWEYYWVGFHGTEARRLLRETGFSPDQPVRHLADTGRLKEYLLCIYRSGGNTSAADADMLGYLYLFLGELMRQTGADRPAATVQDYLTQALRYIQYNYAQPIRVDHIASYVGISRSQLYRAFMQKFAVSPHDFLKRYRVSEACTLLRRPGLTVGEVANSVGFSDPLYFSRVFREMKGVSPSQYQQRHTAQS